MAELTPERWRAISPLLDRALEVEAGERRAWLDREIADPELRAEVAELVAGAERGAGVLDGAAGDYLATILREDGLVDSPPAEASGARVGPYRIVREVGRGGMGVVYEAERADGIFEHRVALKVVRPGFGGRELVGRFERERRIVARLEHPAIARILDGGVVGDGRPYFAMELVDGEPMTAYCDREALSVERRLRLFVQVCDAVQYAHGRLIVHRDLKPSNILVTGDGELKLVDFGIAKILSAEDEGLELTRPGGQRPLTPAYAAPEQLAGEPATIAADVYALGVVLYELIAGRLPFESATGRSGELERAILETDPPAPSRAVTMATGAGSDRAGLLAERAAARGASPKGLARRLSGDLDAIVLTALRREPARRYASVQALREDVESHLEHRPIRARGEGSLVRAAKFVRRHRLGVAGSSLLALSIAAGFGGTLWQARQKTIEAEKARRVSRFVTGLFEAADPARAQGREITARELVEQGSARLESELAGEPQAQAEMGLVLGRINDRLGLAEEALALLERSLERSAASTGTAARKTRADALRAKGAVLVHLGRAEEAEPLLREAQAEHRRLAGPFAGLDEAEDLDELSIALKALGRLEASEAAVLESFALRQSSLAAEDPQLGASYNNLAVIQRELGKLDEAEANYRKALEIRVPALGRNHPETANTFNNLAALLYYRGRYAEAATAFEEVSGTYGRLYGDRHPLTVTALNNLAAVRLKLGELDRAETLYESVLAYWRESAGERHPNALITRGSLGLLYQMRGEARRAEGTFASVVDAARSVLGAEHPVTAIFTVRLASATRDLGRLARARKLAVEGLATLESVYGAEHQHVAAALEELGRTEAELGRYESALGHLRRAVAIRTGQTGGEAVETLAARAMLASALRGSGALEEAEEILEADVATARRALPDRHPALGELLVELARTLAAAGRPAEAEPLSAEAATLAGQRYGAESWRTALVELRQAELWALAGRSAEAGALAARARRILVRELGADHPLSRAAASLASG